MGREGRSNSVLHGHLKAGSRTHVCTTYISCMGPFLLDPRAQAGRPDVTCPCKASAQLMPRLFSSRTSSYPDCWHACGLQSLELCCRQTLHHCAMIHTWARESFLHGSCPQETCCTSCQPQKTVHQSTLAPAPASDLTVRWHLFMTSLLRPDGQAPDFLGHILICDASSGTRTAACRPDTLPIAESF